MFAKEIDAEPILLFFVFPPAGSAARGAQEGQMWPDPAIKGA